jgi:hypothetical protein
MAGIKHHQGILGGEPVEHFLMAREEYCVIAEFRSNNWLQKHCLFFPISVLRPIRLMFAYMD